MPPISENELSLEIAFLRREDRAVESATKWPIFNQISFCEFVCRKLYLLKVLPGNCLIAVVPSIFTCLLLGVLLSFLISQAELQYCVRRHLFNILRHKAGSAILRFILLLISTIVPGMNSVPVSASSGFTRSVFPVQSNESIPAPAMYLRILSCFTGLSAV